MFLYSFGLSFFNYPCPQNNPNNALYILFHASTVKPMYLFGFKKLITFSVDFFYQWNKMLGKETHCVRKTKCQEKTYCDLLNYDILEETFYVKSSELIYIIKDLILELIQDNLAITLRILFAFFFFFNINVILSNFQSSNFSFNKTTHCQKLQFLEFTPKKIYKVLKRKEFYAHNTHKKCTD